MRLGRRGRTPAAGRYTKARQASPSTPWRLARWCVVDLELTGLDPRRDEIVSFGAVPIEHGRIRLAGAVEGLVRPTRPPAEAAVRVHGIRAADLADAPPPREALEPLLDALAGAVPVAHVAGVERAFLGRALRQLGMRMHRSIADTSVLARLWLGERDGAVPGELTLTALAQALALPVHPEHDALGDALTTAQVFIALATHLDGAGAETVGSLLAARRRLRARLAYPPGSG